MLKFDDSAKKSLQGVLPPDFSGDITTLVTGAIRLTWQRGFGIAWGYGKGISTGVRSTTCVRQVDRARHPAGRILGCAAFFPAQAAGVVGYQEGAAKWLRNSNVRRMVWRSP